MAERALGERGGDHMRHTTCIVMSIHQLRIRNHAKKIEALQRVCEYKSHDYQLTSSLASSLLMSCRSWPGWVWLARAHSDCPTHTTAALSITHNASLLRCRSAGVRGRGDLEGDLEEGVFPGDLDLLGVLPDPLW